MRNRNRITVALIMCVMVVGALALCHQPVVTSQLPQLAYAIGGNSAMEKAPSGYMTLCLPQNYKSDPLSQQLIADTAKPNFAKLRSVAKVKIYVDEQSADFEHRFQSDRDSGPVKTLPAVVVRTPDGADHKWSGENVKNAEVQLTACLGLFNRPKPSPCPVEPDEPNDTPTDVPELPDVPGPNDTPAIITKDTDMTLLALSAVAGGFVGWAFMFNRKVSKK